LSAVVIVIAALAAVVFDSEAVSHVHGGVTLVTAPCRFSLHSGANSLHRPEGPTTMLKIILLGSVLAAIAVTLKIRLDTPQGPKPLARAIVTTHLQQLRDDWALP
jgi:hypothetical protein